MPTQKKHTLFTIYFWLVSLVSFIWWAIAIIIFSYQLISLNLISEEEYISQNHWEVSNCEESRYIWTDNFKEKTKSEVEKCKEETRTNLLLQRNVDAKETIILSWLRIIILLIIFPLHFIYFKRYNQYN